MARRVRVRRRNGRRIKSSMPIRYMRKRPAGSILARPFKRSRLAPRARRVAGLRRQRVRRGRPTGGDMTYGKKVWRRRPPIKAIPVIRQLLKMQEHMILRFQGMNRMNAVNDGVGLPGAYYLNFTDPSGSGGAVVPVHVYELTSVRQNTGAFAQCGYQLSFTDTGEPQFSVLPTQTNTGATASSGWQLERSTLASDVVQQRYVKTDWFDIRLNLYGCNTQPAWYDIMLVQIKDENNSVNATSATGGVDGVNRRRLFWQGLAKTLTYNPINPGDNSWFRGMRVIRRYRKLIQATNPYGNADVVDKNPQNHYLKIFYADGRTRNHQWESQSAVTDTDVLNQSWRVTQGTTDATLNILPHPNARLYLIVRCMNTTFTALGESGTAANTPSYDLVIRKKISFTAT